MAEEVIVKYSDDNAATYRTDIKGWVARTGQFWAEDEHMARYTGCTHKDCPECGKLMVKNSWCEPCRHRKSVEKFNALERKEWDGSEFVYSHTAEKWFDGLEEIEDYIANQKFDDDDDKDPEFNKEYPATLEDVNDLRLVFGEPQFAYEIEADEYYEDLLRTDDDMLELPDELSEAFAKLNEVIKNCKTPLSYTPSKIAVDASKLFEKE